MSENNKDRLQDITVNTSPLPVLLPHGTSALDRNHSFNFCFGPCTRMAPTPVDVICLIRGVYLVVNGDKSLRTGEQSQMVHIVKGMTSA